MKYRAWAALAAAMFLMTQPLPATARGGGGHGGGGHGVHSGGHGGGSHHGLRVRPRAFAGTLAAPFWFGPTWWPPTYVAPPVLVQPGPPLYLEPGQPQYWYYCQDPPGYYPYIQQCRGGWIAVVPPGSSTSLESPSLQSPPADCAGFQAESLAREECEYRRRQAGPLPPASALAAVPPAPPSPPQGDTPHQPAE